jgi:hypothetical protein
MRGFILLALSILFAAPASAECVASSGPKAQIAERQGTWIVATDQQWNFLRGVFVMNPSTAAGMPLGDGAVIAHVPGAQGSLILFTDGADLVCGAMPIPKELLDLVIDVGEGKPHHLGDGM